MKKMLTNESKDVSNSRDKDNEQVGKRQESNGNGTVTNPTELLPCPQQLGDGTADLWKEGGEKKDNLVFILEDGDLSPELGLPSESILTSFSWMLQILIEGERWK